MGSYIYKHSKHLSVKVLPVYGSGLMKSKLDINIEVIISIVSMY